MERRLSKRSEEVIKEMMGQKKRLQEFLGETITRGQKGQQVTGMDTKAGQ